MNTSKLCNLFDVPRSSYYSDITDKPISKAKIELNALIRQVFNQSGGSAGARTISTIVTKQHGIKLTRYKAGRLMKQMSLLSRQHKRHSYKMADKPHHTHDNLLERQFSPTAPNQVWTGDVTYIRIKGGWCYLAIVMDLYARRIVGFAMSDSPNTDLTQSALNMAYAVRMKPTGILFHSDQGTHYTSEQFATAIANCTEMTHSMSRKGNCWDNAPTERFFRSLKTEWIPKAGYDDVTCAKLDIAGYIVGYYCQVRPHSFNDYLTPVEKEKQFFNQNLLEPV